MIGFVIRDVPYLKLLHPICEQLIKLNVPYIIYHWDAPRGEKEYNRASLRNLKKSSPSVLKGAVKVCAFAKDEHMFQQMASDNITKVVSVEIWLWLKHRKNWFKNNVRFYNVLYLTDSLWQNPNCIVEMDRVYYCSKYLMKVHHDFSGIKYSSKRDKFLGSTIFDPIVNCESNGEDILVLLPNLRKEHVKAAFGSTERFVKIIDKISQGGDLIFKTRKKQWLPKEIVSYAKEIIEDGDIMYPPITVDLFKRCYCTVMFYSSGIYECVYAGNYVYNIEMPLSRWGWDKKKLEQYFSATAPSVYQFPGVTESLSQDQILGNWIFEPRRIDPNGRDKWVEKFIGINPASGAVKIATDIISS